MNGGLKGHEQITDKSCDPSKSSQLMVDVRAVYVTESQRDTQQQQQQNVFESAGTVLDTNAGAG